MNSRYVCFSEAHTLSCSEVSWKYCWRLQFLQALRMTCTLAELWNKFYVYHYFTASFYFCWFPLQACILFDLPILCSHDEIYSIWSSIFFPLKHSLYNLVPQYFSSMWTKGNSFQVSHSLSFFFSKFAKVSFKLPKLNHLPKIREKYNLNFLYVFHISGLSMPSNLLESNMTFSSLCSTYWKSHCALFFSPSQPFIFSNLYPSLFSTHKTQRVNQNERKGFS